jgi:hypothetical protein
MTRYECLSCGGIYDPDQPGGYYHVCPPIAKPTGRRISFKMPDGTVIQTEEVEYLENPDKRDENIDPKTGKMKGEGKGRRPVVQA